MDYNELALKLHEDKQGKLEVQSKVKIETKEDLSIVYTPGVAEPCRKIAENINDVYRYTSKGNLVAVVTDGTAVLGLGDIGPEAGLPVMEGKCALFKTFANVDAIPICLDTKDTHKIVETIVTIAPSFGGINLEDIAAPRCFEIEARLKERLSIPVFHDDQHGTAIVLLAALINALKVVKKDKESIKVVISGAGAAGSAIGKLLLQYGIKNLIYTDRFGILNEETAQNDAQRALCAYSNFEQTGTLADALVDADVFIGVSAPNIVTPAMIQAMKEKPIVFPLANPIPEIQPEEALKAGAEIVGTGRSDYPNQINNVLVFPGLFRGALDARAREITEGMKLAAAYAIANLITEEKLKADYIIPDVFDARVANAVAEAVKEEARKANVTSI